MARALREPDLSAHPGTASVRPSVRGKFLWAGDEKLLVRGVTYGSFAPNRAGDQFPEPHQVERDLLTMAAHSINTIRTYTVPPRWLLDVAVRSGLRVMVGIPWEEHLTFLDSRSRARKIERNVAQGVGACAEHPAVLAYVIGSEIPASVVRWHGPARITAFLARLCRAAREADPGGLLTYANYPSTEYLDAELQDFVSFNVFLESQERLQSYLRRLQNIAGDRPLVLTELGLDSRRHGELAQAASLGTQVTTAFEAGCAGAFVFSWTDEWFRSGSDIEDWDFGLVRRDRSPKPSLTAVQEAFDAGPFGNEGERPRISVVVCTHNGGSTIGACLDALTKMDYLNYEVIVVDDGSTDDSAEIAETKGVRVLRTPQAGLSTARNIGLAAATGEVVAYIDDDAWPDPDWLSYLALTLKGTKHVAVGGPNVPPPVVGTVQEAVTRAPGGPIHVMLGDDQAEHIPGCNMAFRRSALETVGGFDPQFWVAGDDVDMCWRLQAMGWTLGFSPAAMVWHRRRPSVRAYLRQQVGYGKAEALLERKWPEHYNGGGHVKWAGRVYPGGGRRANGSRWRIYYGPWGAGLFQSIYTRPAGFFASLPLMPQSYLLMAAMALLVVGGLLWQPLLIRLPGIGLPVPVVLLAFSVGALIAQAMVSGWRAFPGGDPGLVRRIGCRLMTGLLYLAQPVARLWGRMRHGLTPWRRRGWPALAAPWPHRRELWSEHWQAIGAWARGLEHEIHNRSLETRRATAFDRWDLEAGSGLLVATRLRLAIEEHGHETQLIRVRVWPRFSRLAMALVAASLGLLILGLLGHSNAATVVMLGVVFGAIALRLGFDAAATAAVCNAAFEALRARQTSGVCVANDDREPAELDDMEDAVEVSPRPFADRTVQALAAVEVGDQ